MPFRCHVRRARVERADFAALGLRVRAGDADAAPAAGLASARIESWQHAARALFMILPQIASRSADAHRSWREIRGKAGPCMKFLRKSLGLRSARGRRSVTP